MLRVIPLTIAVVLQSLLMTPWVQASTDWEKIISRIEDQPALRSYKVPAARRPWSGYQWHGRDRFLNREFRRGEGAVSKKFDLIAPAPPQGGLFAYIEDYIKEAYPKGVSEMEGWNGLCDGWSIAAQIFPKPLHSVEWPLTTSGRSLKFYPAEIMGLASAAFSMGLTPDLSNYIQVTEVKDPVQLLEILIDQFRNSETPWIGNLGQKPEVQNHGLLDYSISLKTVPFKKTRQVNIEINYIRSHPASAAQIYQEGPPKDLEGTRPITIEEKLDKKTGELKPFFVDWKQVPVFWTLRPRLLQMRDYFEGRSPRPSIGDALPVHLETLKQLSLKSR